MNAQDKIRLLIVKAACQGLADTQVPEIKTKEQLEEFIENCIEQNEAFEDYMSDSESDLRSSYQYETDVPCEYSRHYESQSVAYQMDDGTWVGWTYWYGGGKHGEPESIDWIREAYDLDVVEEEKLIVVRKFSKVEEK